MRLGFRWSAAAFAAVSMFAALVAAAHPGSGIVVDKDGRVYFVHAEVGVWSADADGGNLSRLEGPAWHFLIADEGGRFTEQRWPQFEDGNIRATGPDPKLLRGSSFPLAIGPDGALYYPRPDDRNLVHIMRLEPGGEPAEHATLPPITEIGYEGDPVQARWIHGLAAGRDGSLYYTEQNAIRLVSADGAVTVIADTVRVPDCSRPPAFADGRDVAFLRGIDVADDGTVYAAASGCSAVIKVATDGTMSVALRAEQPWSPTGVAFANGDLYVLEFQYIDVERAGEWLPRVRKLAQDGVVSTVATVSDLTD